MGYDVEMEAYANPFLPQATAFGHGVHQSNRCNQIHAGLIDKNSHIQDALPPTLLLQKSTQSNSASTSMRWPLLKLEAACIGGPTTAILSHPSLYTHTATHTTIFHLEFPSLTTLS